MISSSGSLRARLFLAFALITLIATAIPAVVTRNTLYNDRLELTVNKALAHAAFARSVLESSPTPKQVEGLFQTAFRLSYRMTLTDNAGTVVRDTHIDDPKLGTLDNHSDRPEIEEALKTGQGVAIRHSTSLDLDTVYAAMVLEDGRVLRLAVPAAEVQRGLEEEFTSLGLAAGGVAVFCLFLSAIVTAQVRNAANSMAEVVASIAREKSFRRLREVPGKEFLPLAYAVNSMADSIEEYVAKTRDQHGQLESILEAMHEGVLVVNPAGKIRHWNKALEAMFPAITGAKDKSVIEGIPVPALQSHVEKLLEEEERGSVQDGRVQFQTDSGRFLVANITRPLHSKESLGAIIVLYDATDIMRLDAMRRDFVSNVSHELRTPLTAIQGYSEVLMLGEGLPEEQKNFVTIIHNHAEYLSKLVSNLLMLSRIENERGALEVSMHDLDALFSEATNHCREMVESKTLTIKSNFRIKMVAANGPLLVQVLRNLLENACRYAPRKSIIDVLCQPEGRELRIAFADYGPGIPKDALPRIFERFYQVKGERNTGTSGVGLAICKHIVERHGGRIWAESPYGPAGTAIIFTLPLPKQDNHKE